MGTGIKDCDPVFQIEEKLQLLGLSCQNYVSFQDLLVLSAFRQSFKLERNPEHLSTDSPCELKIEVFLISTMHMRLNHAMLLDIYLCLYRFADYSSGYPLTDID